MIIPDHELEKWAKNGGVSPFAPDHINPASIDLTLGSSYINLIDSQEQFIVDNLVIVPGQAILATTAEYIVLPPYYAGAVYLKSSMARLGLDHALAGWVDPGFEGQLTLELHSHRPIVLHTGQRIVQLVLYKMSEQPRSAYNGRYQGQRGPTMARVQTSYNRGKIEGLSGQSDQCW